MLEVSPTTSRTLPSTFKFELLPLHSPSQAHPILVSCHPCLDSKRLHSRRTKSKSLGYPNYQIATPFLRHVHLIPWSGTDAAPYHLPWLTILWLLLHFPHHSVIRQRRPLSKRQPSSRRIRTTLAHLTSIQSILCLHCEGFPRRNSSATSS